MRPFIAPAPSVVVLVLVLVLALALSAVPAGSTPGRGEMLPAAIHALRDVRVPAEVSGRVVKRPQDESAAVKAGQVVVMIDAVLLRAGARAARAAARRARAHDEWSEIERKRVAALFEKGTVGQAELDRAEVAAREAAAILAGAEASATQAETRLDRTSIAAPFDGKLVRVYAKAGEYIRTGETAFRIIDDSSLKIIVYVPARLLARLRPRAPLSVESDLAGMVLPPLQATVFSVAPAAEGKARTYRVEARAHDQSGRWRPGMTGQVFFPR